MAKVGSDSNTTQSGRTSRSRLVAAVETAIRDWSVLPLHWIEDGKCSCGCPDCAKAGKHPLTTHGLTEATSDLDQVRKWWLENPKANIGIATGSPSGIIVLDIDPRHDGYASLRKLEERYSPLPDGPRVRTGGGGEHLYLMSPLNVRIASRIDLLPGIDVRAEGAYVVGAGSDHVSGKRYLYRYGKQPSDLPLPPCPTWLIELTSQRTERKAGTAVREGRRNRTLTSLGGGMRSRGFSREAIEAALLEENRVLCRPPLDEAEVRTIAVSVSRYSPRTRSARTDEVKGGGARPNLPFRTAADVERETPDTVNWVARPFMAIGASTELDGKVKTAGKTTFVLAMVRAVLDGVPFMGNSTKKTAVVYLTEQNPASFREAMKRANLLRRKDFIILFWKDTLGVPWCDVVDGAVEECKKRGAEMLVVDTLTQFAGLEGESENNAGNALEDMQPLQRAAAAEIAVLVVRHERKTGGTVGDSARGSSAYPGTVDIVLSLRRPEGNQARNVRLLQAVSRLGEGPGDLLIELTEDGYRAIGEPGDAAVERDKTDVLTVIPDQKRNAEDIQALGRRARMSRARLQRRLNLLLSEGKIRKTGKGVKGDPVRYFADR